MDICIYYKGYNNNNNKHPGDDIDRQYVSRKEGGRGLSSIQDSINASIQQFKDNIKKHKGRLIAVTRNYILFHHIYIIIISE